MSADAVAAEAVETDTDVVTAETTFAFLRKLAEKGLDGRPMCHYMVMYLPTGNDYQRPPCRVQQGRTRAEVLLEVLDRIRRSVDSARFEHLLRTHLEFSETTWKQQYFNFFVHRAPLWFVKIDSATYDWDTVRLQGLTILGETPPLVKATRP